MQKTWFLNKAFFCFRIREYYDSNLPGLVRLCNLFGDKLFCCFFPEIFRNGLLEFIQLVFLFCKKVSDIVRHDDRLDITADRFSGISKFTLRFEIVALDFLIDHFCNLLFVAIIWKSFEDDWVIACWHVAFIDILLGFSEHASENM